MRRSIFSIAAALFIAATVHHVTYAQGNTGAAIRQGTVTYLYDMIPTKMSDRTTNENMLTSGWHIDKCTLDGVDYLHSVAFGRPFGDNQGSATFNVRGYDYFDVTVGVVKQSPEQNYKVRYIILGDNNRRLLTTPTQTQGVPSFRLHVSLHNITELTLKYVLDDNSDLHGIWWGDARLIKGSEAKTPISKPPPPELVDYQGRKVECPLRVC